MPQPYRGSGVGWGPNTILDRPDLAVYIANVVGNWVYVEDQLNWIFSILLSLKYGDAKSYWDISLRHEKTNILHYDQLNPLGSQILDTLNSHVPKLDLIERLLNWWNLDEELRKFQDLKIKVRKRAVERNTVAHGLWGTAANDELKDAFILVEKDRSDRMGLIYTCRDFVQISERILELDENLKKFSSELYEKFHLQK